MTTEEQLKSLVRTQYAKIANQSYTENATSCCGAGGCGVPTVEAAVMAESYEHLEGYVPEADLGLGCGLPTAFAQMREGDTVVDLGSGAGNDCFIARRVVGENGNVIGVDMTAEMIEKARANASKLGYQNVSFRLGEIEHMPLENNLADVVVSNCVLNLVPNKHGALKETFRVLKPGGHFSISDIVLRGDLPQGLRNDAEMYAGCVSGAIQMDDYLAIIQETGFVNITVQKQREITLPVGILRQYLTDEEIARYKTDGTGIFSITVYAEKPQ